MRQFLASLLVLFMTANSFAGILITRSSGISLTGADGVQYVGMNGISLTGADGFLTATSNGISLTGADGLPITSPSSLPSTGANNATYTGPNGISLTGADGISLTGADGISLTGADGVLLTLANGTQRSADSIVIRRPNGISLTGADGISLTGADGISLTGADGIAYPSPNVTTIARSAGISLTGADGISLTGADGISLTGADSIVGIGPAGVIFTEIAPSGISLTGADDIWSVAPSGISLTGADNIVLTGVEGVVPPQPNSSIGLQGFDPELAVKLNSITDDSSVNAIIVFHHAVTQADLQDLMMLGVVGGTRMRALPMVYVTCTKLQLAAISRLPSVRSIYGNRTLNFNSDPYFNITGVQRVATDRDLRRIRTPYTGRGVTVAVLDTGINGLHGDLAGRIAQNVRLADIQSVPAGFQYPVPQEGLVNTDPVAGHGTFVSGIIAGSGSASNGKYAGVAPGATLLGLSTGDVNLVNVLSGFDYLLDKGPLYGVKVVNCSFSADTVYDTDDPVNIATRMLTDNGVNIVFSAGNSGAGTNTMNPYALAPWVIGVGATDQNGILAGFSSRGDFGDTLQHPSLVAPGVSVASIRSTPSTTSVGGIAGADVSRLAPAEIPFYTTASGTSFSAPQVAGAIALMLEADPSLSPARIKDILAATATPMPKYFYHEAGAGMLNTYAAVLEAAYPARVMGEFRSTLSRNSVRFVTSATPPYSQLVIPGITASRNFSIPANTVQASVNIAWSLSTNDLGLKLFNGSNVLLGESNYLNLPGLTARREKVVLRNPGTQTIRAAVSHTGGIGTPQTILGSLETTSVTYPDLTDLNGLPAGSVADARSAMLMSIMLPLGRRFRPTFTVSRADLAEALVRAGLVPQYVASAPLYADVQDNYTRNFVESVQKDPDGGIFDEIAAQRTFREARITAPSEARFYPDTSATRLVAAVAFVRAAGLASQAGTAQLPANVSDAASIPVELRGYVAVALQHGFLTLDGSAFNPSRGLTRLELAGALSDLLQ